MGVLGTSSKANAALLIDFDNILFDGGTITSLGGGNYSGSGIMFDSIYLKDTSVPGPLAGVQCGATGGVAGANTCKLSFNTLTGAFDVDTPAGLYDIGPDLLPYTGDAGALVAGRREQCAVGRSFRPSRTSARAGREQFPSGCWKQHGERRTVGFLRVAATRASYSRTARSTRTRTVRLAREIWSPPRFQNRLP